MDIHALFSPEEKPLDRLLTHGGYMGIFRRIACVGDSLSSGEFEVVHPDGSKSYHDCFEYSWGQNIARIAGLTAFNFSRGGMTAKEFCDNYANQMGYWRPELWAQAYIVAMGVNDVSRVMDGTAEFGCVEDIDFETPERSADTLCGNYGKLLLRYRAICPDSFLFLMTMPRCCHESPERTVYNDRHAALLYAVAERLPRTYVLDFRKYAPVYDEEFTKRYYLEGHLNPMGYILTAQMIISYIDYLIRRDPAAFAEVGFIGTDVLDFRK